MLNPTPVPEESSTLFLGDLSVFCTEKDIRKLFRPFGPIEAIRVKRGSSNKTNLSYGFIKFTLPESAEQSMKQLNGVMFLGRALRIGWAEGKNPMKIPRHKDEKKPESAQVHVSFISKQVDVLISEATLRGLFSLYGEVTDVALKKSQFDRNLKIQNGYGFIHYPLTPEGVRSAITAVHSLHQVTIDRVTYDCSVSHALEELLGPTNIEDNPGAVPLNDRGFCLPVNVMPVVPRLPQTMYQDQLHSMSSGMDPMIQHRNNGNNQMYKMTPMPYQVEPPMSSFQPVTNGYMQYTPKTNSMPYNMTRPPLPPPTPGFPPTPVMSLMDARLSNPGFMPPPPLPLMQPPQPLYPPVSAVSSDSYDSLIAGTDRLTLSASQDSHHNQYRDSINSRDSSKRPGTSSSTGSYQSSIVSINPPPTAFLPNQLGGGVSYASGPMNLQPVYSSPNSNAATTIFDAKNYYF